MASRIRIGPEGGPFVVLDEATGDYSIDVPNDTIDVNNASINNVANLIENITVEDDGTQVLDTANLNFGTNVSVTDDGDGTVTVDATGDTDTRIDVSDDGTLVLSEPTDVNFGTNLSATDDGDGTATINATGDLSAPIALEEYATAEDVPDASEVTQPTIAYVGDVGDGTDDYLGVFES